MSGKKVNTFMRDGACLPTSHAEKGAKLPTSGAAKPTPPPPAPKK